VQTHPSTAAGDASQYNATTASLLTEGSKPRQSAAIDHWDPSGKYSFSQHHHINQRKKTAAVSKDAGREEQPSTCGQESISREESHFVDEKEHGPRQPLSGNLKLAQDSNNLRKQAKTAKMKKRLMTVDVDSGNTKAEQISVAIARGSVGSKDDRRNANSI